MKYSGTVFALLVFLVSVAGQAAPADSIHWKAVLVTGYATSGGIEIDNWENARDAMHQLLLGRGVTSADVRLLTARPSLVGSVSRGARLELTSVRALADALVSLNLGPGDGLIVFLTSHGSRGGGFVLEHGTDVSTVLTPAELGLLLGSASGALPTLVLISACFSGQFLEAGGVTAENRVVLTAARKDRSSFGCGAGSSMPEWDQSLLEVWGSLDGGADWTALTSALTDAITQKEQALPEGRKSHPQAFIGSDVTFLPRLRDATLGSYNSY